MVSVAKKKSKWFTSGIPKGAIVEGLVAIDLMGDHVKLAYVRESQGSVKVASLAEKKFPENSDAAISAFLASSLKEWRLKKTHVLCLIPSKLFISKNIDMPSKDPEEIRKIVDLQAHRYTPYSRDEIVIDYLCMETPGQHYTNVLLIIVNRKVTDRYTRIFDQAGIELEQQSIKTCLMGKTNPTPHEVFGIVRSFYKKLPTRTTILVVFVSTLSRVENMDRVSTRKLDYLCHTFPLVLNAWLRTPNLFLTVV